MTTAVQTDPPGLAPNAALLWQVLEHIKAHPETWNQRTWYCGTRACFAGHAVLLSGSELAQATGLGGPTMVKVPPDHPLMPQLELHVPLEDWGWLSVPDYARVALGLNRAQARRLFYRDNTYQELEWMVQGITGLAQAPAVALAPVRA